MSPGRSPSWARCAGAVGLDGRDLPGTLATTLAYRRSPAPDRKPARKDARERVVTALVVFVAIFFAELPDKTAFTSLDLGTRYRSSLVFAGVAAAFVVHVVLAVAAGSLLRLLPHRSLEFVVAVLFVLGAALLLREGLKPAEAEDAEVPVEGLSPGRVVAMSFGVILVAEFGDLTQVLTANLAAKYHDPIAVGLGALCALWAVGLIGILGGKALLARVSLTLITRIAAAIMLVLAAYSAIEAVRG